MNRSSFRTCPYLMTILWLLSGEILKAAEMGARVVRVVLPLVLVVNAVISSSAAAGPQLHKTHIPLQHSDLCKDGTG